MQPNILMVVGIPYILIAIVIMVGLTNVSIIKWSWNDPPYYIRFLVGILWPFWVLIAVLYDLFSRAYKD